MKWPWQHPAGADSSRDTATVPDDEDARESLARARQASTAALEALSRARRQRPQVVAAGHALRQTESRNHLAELIRSALGSGS